MSHTIKNADGKTILHIVAKTSRGFNTKQRKAVRLARTLLDIDPHFAGTIRPGALTLTGKEPR